MFISTEHFATHLQCCCKLRALVAEEWGLHVFRPQRRSAKLVSVGGRISLDNARVFVVLRVRKQFQYGSFT